MSHYRLEVGTVSRRKGQSVTRLAHYISGCRLHDSYNGRTYHKKRNDVLFCKIFQPSNAPSDFGDLQHLCDKIEEAEHRCDARTARQFIGSLPNELSCMELVRIVHEFITSNFVSHGLCAIAAVHEGQNELDPTKNNPHAHIIVTTRTVGPEGFSKKKDRKHDAKEYINIWREQWALVQNRAYERNGLDIRVSHESLEIQGVRDREPTIYLSRIDWQKEQRGERTRAGDEKRAVENRNKERILRHQRELMRKMEKELSR